MFIFNGKKFADGKEQALKAKVAVLKQKGFTPKMVSILVGDNPESELYISLKKKAAERVGIKMEIVRFSEGVKSEEVIECIENLNKDPTVQGIMVQLPIKTQSSKLKSQNQNSNHKSLELEILRKIEPKKDVDCLTPENLGLLMMGKPRFLPATVRAVIEIIGEAVTSVILGKPKADSRIRFWTSQNDSLEALRQAQGLARMTTGAEGVKKWLAGENICLVGASDIVGKPLAMVLSDAGAAVTICRSTTKNLSEFTKRADILISATGVPGLIKKEMVKEGAVVIDVGVTRYEDIKILGYKVKGDVEKDVAEMAGFLTPVPGGVGPVTVICLLENLVEVGQNYV